MGRTAVIAAAVAAVWLCAMTGQASAQTTWKEFISKQDRFGVNFPGDPVVTTIMWTSEHGAVVPARVYSATNGPSKYSVTVVDYNLVKDQLMEKGRQCPPAVERCLGTTGYSGLGYWKADLRGAMHYTLFQFLKRDIKVTHLNWNYLGQGPEATELQFLNNADQSRTFVSMYMHHNVLYVLEGTVPGNYPAPGLFQQSIALYEADGTRASHGKVFFNGAELDPNETFDRAGGPGPVAGAGAGGPVGRGR